jgi:putative iron-dependent peroxidase
VTEPQPGILGALPPHGRFVELIAIADRDPRPSLARLAARQVDDQLVIGIGPSLVDRLGATIPGLRGFPALARGGCNIPSTQCDLWLWSRGTDRGHVLHHSRAALADLGDAFRIVRCVDGFVFDRGRDLTGYEDGTENPRGDNANLAAIIAGRGSDLDGGSFVAVQQWRHDLDHFQSLPETQRDRIIGRRRSDNVELADAPASAHVKRTAQESFSPPALVLRRSMPWADASGAGLIFVAFGRSLDAFEIQLRRMAGEEDEIIDGLFRFSTPMTGSYFWCPPVVENRVSLAVFRL